MLTEEDCVDREWDMTSVPIASVDSVRDSLCKALLPS